jgi:hypothetical protein
MQTINRFSLVKKTISFSLIYILLLDIMVPSLYAMELLSQPNRLQDESASMKIENSKNNPATEEINQILERHAIDNTVMNQALLSSSLAVSSSASQPEVSGFSIGSTDGMVDKFTGDFTYSIPLVDAEGYPITLTYNSNVSMLDEASWVGLGWNLNVGSISRDMRGIPDEFNGEDIVTRQFKQAPVGVDGSKDGGYTQIGFGNGKFGGGIGISFLAGKYEDNYLGIGKTYDLNIGGSARYSVQSNGEGGGLFLQPTINLGMSYDSKNGIGSTFGFGLSAGNDNGANSVKSGSVTYQRSKHSRGGLLSQSFSLAYSNQKYGVDTKKDIGFGLSSSNFSTTSSFSYGTATSIPRVNFNSATSSSSFELDIYAGLNLKAVSMRLGYLHQSYSTSSAIKYHFPDDMRIDQPAYGYFHSGKRKVYTGPYSPIMDFNRGIENEYSEDMAMLPFSVQTHDVFYVNGGGVNGTFRGMRTDYGTYYDANSESTYNEDSQLFIGDNVTTLATGAIFSIPLTIGFGIAYSTATMKANQASGNWNQGMNLLEFQLQPSSKNFDESVYFKPMGVVTPVDMSAWNQMNGNIADYFDINVSGGQIIQEPYLKKKDYTLPSPTLTSQRSNGDIYFRPNTVADLTFSGAPDIISKYESVSSAGAVLEIDRLSTDKKGNHISSIDVVTPNGVKYQYGIPVYSYKKDEVTFSCEGRPELIEGGVGSGIIEYQPGDNSISNNLAVSKYFDKTTLPAYPQAFLLTQAVSSDYIDVKDDGPTIDDIGNYYKFRYTRVYGPGNIYGTRFPISGTASSGKKAFYAKGALGSDRDNLANYTYQEGEVWYTHSVETKNLIIEFHLENRADAYSANEDGILQSGKPMKKLDKIVVYNRIEKITNVNALPLQTILFDYDYSLCPNAPGNLNTYNSPSGESGKLTLKEIRVYNGNSLENALSAIKFEYSSGAENPPFSYANMDTWGQYKLNTSVKPNDLYPYANQTLAEATQSARAWKLIAINNPMGGRIEIDYESDTYAYVQNKRAMKNFDVYRMTDLFDFIKLRNAGLWNGVSRYGGGNMEKKFHHDYSSVANFVNENDVHPDLAVLIEPAIFNKKPHSPYNQEFGQFDVKLVPNTVIVFKLDRPLVMVTPDQIFADNYVRDLYFKDPDNPTAVFTEIYTKMYVEIKEDVYDLVPTMSKISDAYTDNPFNGFFAFNERFEPYGAMPPNANGEYEYGYVIVNPVHTGDREGKKGVDKLKKGTIAMHPMQLTALEYARAALPDKVYGSDPASEGDLSIDWKVYYGNDMYKYMIEAGYCNNFDRELGAEGPYRSLIRLNEPNYTKYGGGARVKEIRYLDNWRTISGEDDSHYSWRYKYTKTENREEKSNGVAAFEPMSIVDESPFNKWHTYINVKKKFPDENKFIPGPVDYQLFPKPIVGYSEVNVEFVEAGKYGKSTTSYYTAKNYPTVYDFTTIDKSAKVSKNNIITGNVRDFYGITQGYITETNDFHGKIKSAEVFSKNMQNEYIPISQTVYEYYGKGEQLKMADRAGNLGMYNAAIEYDIHGDSRYCTDETKFYQLGLDFVLNWTPPIFFTPSFSPIFAMSSRERAFYSHTLIKHINYSPVLKSVTTNYLRSINTTSTTVFDKYTGNPVVSELTDEYDDRLYQVNYPSHWKYKELRGLYEVEDVSVVVNLGMDGHFIPSVTNTNDLLTPGDLVLVDGNQLQVAQEWPWPENGELFLITVNGETYLPSTSGNKTVKIIRSGRDNRILETMQGFTTKVNPAAGTAVYCPSDQILSASAISYRDRLTTDCHCNGLDDAPQYNPYDYGIHGDLVLDKQFAWQSERNASDPHGIRFDGAYRSANPGDPNFILFYDLNGGKWNPINFSNHPQHDTGNIYRSWRPLGNVTLFDKYANAVESKDQINVYSSVLTGNGETYNSLIYAQAVNAQRRQIAFDGFEDYLVMSPEDRKCRFLPTNTHFGFFNYVESGVGGVEIDLSNRHSGLASLKVAPQNMASVTKTLIDEACFPMTPARGMADRDPDSADSCPCLPSFSPTPGKYIISAWVKGDTENSILTVNLQEGGTHTEYNFSAQGPVLDGWRRVEGVFEVTTGITHITVNLENTHLSDPAFFDDLRIHPFLAGMQTTVYDPVTFLPLATHDGYNFTTFYNYDENLNLVRIRVETVEGIKTVMEQESGGQKSYLSE